MHQEYLISQAQSQEKDAAKINNPPSTHFEFLFNTNIYERETGYDRHKTDIYIKCKNKVINQKKYIKKIRFYIRFFEIPASLGGLSFPTSLDSVGASDSTVVSYGSLF